MIDSDLVSKLLEYDSKGKDGIQEMRDLLKQEGGISRLIGLAKRGVDRITRTETKKMRSRLPDEFPGEKEKQAAVAYWEKQRRPDLIASIDSECEKFVDHHTQHGKAMADWGCAWRTWYRNAVQFNAPPRDGSLGLVVPIYEPPRSPADAVTRLEIFYGKSPDCDAGTWTPKWGPNPDDPNCRISAESRTAFQTKYGPRRAQQ